MKHSEKTNHSWGYKMVHTFPKDISSKVNVIASVEFELTYFEVAVQHFSQNTMEFPLPKKKNQFNILCFFSIQE